MKQGATVELLNGRQAKVLKVLDGQYIKLQSKPMYSWEKAEDLIFIATKDKISRVLLNNPAELISYKKSENGFVVLARASESVFVTWVTDDKGNAYCGHYHASDKQKAVEDFNERR